MSNNDPFTCPECGCDTFIREAVERVFDRCTVMVGDDGPEVLEYHKNLGVESVVDERFLCGDCEFEIPTPA